MLRPGAFSFLFLMCSTFLGQDLHAYALYWTIGVSSNVLCVLKLQWTNVGWGVEGNALFQDPNLVWEKSHPPSLEKYYVYS